MSTNQSPSEGRHEFHEFNEEPKHWQIGSALLCLDCGLPRSAAVHRSEGAFRPSLEAVAEDESNRRQMAERVPAGPNETQQLGCAAHGFKFREGCDACSSAEPSGGEGEWKCHRCDRSILVPSYCETCWAFIRSMATPTGHNGSYRSSDFSAAIKSLSTTESWPIDYPAAPTLAPVANPSTCCDYHLRGGTDPAYCSQAVGGPVASEAELKSCPCCAWTPERICSPRCFAGVPGWRIRCDKCGLKTTWWHSPEEANTAWNRRADLHQLTPAEKAEVEEIKTRLNALSPEPWKHKCRGTDVNPQHIIDYDFIADAPAIARRLIELLTRKG